MKTKHFIGIAVVIAISLSCFGGIGFASEDIEYQEDHRLKIMEFLKQWEIIPDYQEYNIDMGQRVTRGDLAKAIYSVYDVKETSEPNVYYYDVPENHWACRAVGYLTEIGILKGSGDKLFAPEEFATVEQAYKMMVTALGYSYMAEAQGGFPGGYLMAATRIKLSEGIHSSGELTLGDMFILLDNFLRIEIAEASAFTDETATYGVSVGETLLSRYRSVYSVRGTLNSVNGVHIGTDKSADVDEVCIGELVCKTKINLVDLLGRNIEAFYKLDKLTGVRTVTWAEPLSDGDVKEIVVDYDGVFNEKTYQLSYYSGNKTRQSITLARNIIVVYNGRIVNERVSDIFKKDRYTVKLVENRSGNYYLAIVKAYEDYVISKIDKSNFKAYDRKDPKKFVLLDPDEYEFFNMVVSQTIPMTFEELKEDYVLSVYKSKCGEAMEVQVCTGQISGTIETIKTKENGEILVVNSTEYFRPNTAGGDMCKVGSKVLLYLNIAGEVVYAKETDSVFFAAYLVDSKDDGVFQSELQIKYLNQSGAIEIKSCANRVRMDGNTYKHEDLRELLNIGGKFQSQIALLTLNGSDEIISIDTAKPDADGNENSLQLHEKDVTGTWRSAYGYVGKKSPADQNTVFFLVSTTPANDDDFRVIKYSNFIRVTSTFTAETYRIGNRAGIVDYVVVKDRYIEEDPAIRPVLVKEIISGMDEEGDLVEQIVGYQSGNEVILTARNKLTVDGVSYDSCTEADLKEGTFIQILQDENGLIEKITRLFDPTNSRAYINGSPNINYTQNFIPLVAYAHDVVDSVVQVGYADGANFDQAFKTNDVPVMIYDSNKERDPISIGTVNEIDTYYNASDGNNCSILAIVMQQGHPISIVVYK